MAALRTIVGRMAGEGCWINANRARCGHVPVKSPAEVMQVLRSLLFCSVIHFWRRTQLPD